MNSEELETEIMNILTGLTLHETLPTKACELLMELFRRSDGRAAEGPLDPLVVEPERAQQMQREDNAHPRRAEPATSDPARCRPVTRSAEALTLLDFDVIARIIRSVNEDPHQRCDLLFAREEIIARRLKRAGYHLSRNSDGERSEHRADNSELSGR